MAKLYFIFLLCALTSAEHAGLHYSNEDTSLPGLYHAVSTQSRSSSSSDGNEHSAYVSHTGAVRSGTGTTSSYTEPKAHHASTSNVKDHNGLTHDEVLKLAAEGNRRQLYKYLQTGPKRYNYLVPPYSPYPNLGSPYTPYRMFSRNEEGADTNSAQSYGSSGVHHKVNARSVENVGNGYDGNASSEKARQEEEAENARRFFLLNNRYNPPNANNPLDPYAELNAKNYNEAFGQYKKFLN